MQRLSAYAVLVLVAGLFPGCGSGDGEKPAAAPPPGAEAAPAPTGIPASTAGHEVNIKDVSTEARTEVDPEQRGGAKNASVNERNVGSARPQ
jgi:hypothetical protein